jgi:Ni,Fe-hydrogenase III large subunit
MAHTGIVPPYMASELGLIGVALRACGIPLDARSQFPLYDGPWHKPADGLRGDVYSRAYVRSQELDASAEIARQHLEALRDAECDFTPAAMPEKLPANRLAVAQVEGWRGEVCHIAVTDAEGKFNTYKIVDPSFRNWKGLTLALRDQEISDFPLCNKSFNLSYCGHDL